MGKNDAPSLWKADPGLALAAASDMAFDVPLEGYRDAGNVFAERDNLQPLDGSRQVNWGTRFAKRFNLADPVETLSRAKARDKGRRPEHADQGLYIVRDQGLLVAGIEFAQLGNSFRVVDHHNGQNIFLVGSTHLGMAALTVIMGSLTTWLIRNFMATLHSK